MTTSLAQTYEVIGIEDLNVKGMVQHSRLARSLSDVALGEAIRQLEYKTQWFGSVLQKVDRFFPSSKRCYHCGYTKTDLKLSDQQWLCPNCQSLNHRDQNASLNIREEAFNLLKAVPVVATSAR